MRLSIAAIVVSALGSLLLAGCPWVSTGQDPRQGSSSGTSASNPTATPRDTGTGTTADTRAADGPPAPDGASTTSTGGQDSTPAGTTSNQLTAQCADCGWPPEEDDWRAEVLRLVNEERRDQGLAMVTWNVTLADQAASYACELICDGFFAHVNPGTGSTLPDRADASGYQYWAIGENLAAGWSTPVAVVAAWMDSRDHRENVLHPAFMEMGVAVRTGGEYGIYWVQVFGRPRDAGPYEGSE